MNRGGMVPEQDPEGAESAAASGEGNADEDPVETALGTSSAVGFGIAVVLAAVAIFALQSLKMGSKPIFGTGGGATCSGPQTRPRPGRRWRTSRRSLLASALKVSSEMRSRRSPWQRRTGDATLAV